MRIQEIATERVRSLPDRTWPLAPGLQILQGPNEAGKSALHEALRLGLYVDAATNASVFLRAQRWGAAEGMVIRLVFTTPAGTHTLIRDFADKRNTLIHPDGTKVKSHQQILQFLRTHLPLPTMESFLATACVQQGELARVLSETKTLRPLLEQHALSGVGVDLKTLERRLDQHIGEIARGMERTADANPGKIAELRRQYATCTDTLTRLTQQATTQAQAAANLVTSREQLATAQTDLTRVRERLTNHRLYQDARTQFAAAQARIAAVQTRLDRAAALAADLPRLVAIDLQAGAALAAAQARITQAERIETLAQQAQGIRNSIAQDTETLTQVARLQAERTTQQAERQRIPLSAEDFTNLRTLPGEIGNLTHDVAASDAARADLRAHLDSLAAADAADRDRRLALETERPTLQQTLTAAEQRQAAEAARQEVTRDLATKAPVLDRLRTLQATVQRLTEALAPFAYLDSVDLSGFRGLLSQVEGLQNALRHSGFIVHLAPKRPLTFTVQTDQDPTQEYPDQTDLLSLPAGSRAAIAVDGLLDIEVRNLGDAATQLTTAQATLQDLLTAMRCSGRMEAEALLAARERAQAEAKTAQTAYRAALGSASLAALEAELGRLRTRDTALARTLADLPAGDRSPETLRAALQQIAIDLTALQTAGQAREADRARTQAILATDPAAKTRDEITRKAAALATLRARLGDDTTPVDVLEAQLQACDEAIARLDTAVANILGGRTADRLAASLAEAISALASLEEQLAAAQADALDPDGLTAAREALGELEGAATAAHEVLLRAQGELAGIDRTADEAERTASFAQYAFAQNQAADKQDFQLSPDERLEFEGRVKSLEATLPDLQQEVARLEVQADIDATLQARIAEAEQEKLRIEQQMERWGQKLRVDRDIRTLLTAARERAVADLTQRHLPALVGRALATVTDLRHTEVRVEGSTLSVWSPTKGALLDAEHELSTGTRDQLYLAVRLAYLEALFPDNRPPLLLDDPLVHCDPVRRAAVLRLLAAYAATGQVLLFTCHTFPEYAGYPILAVGS